MRKFLSKIKDPIMFFILTTPLVSFAADPLIGGTVTGDTNLNPIGPANENLGQLLAAIFNALIAIGVPIAILMLVYSGYLFATALGDEKKVSAAKDNFKYTVIGIAVLLGAKAIVLMVQSTVSSL